MVRGDRATALVSRVLPGKATAKTSEASLKSFGTKSDAQLEKKSVSPSPLKTGAEESELAKKGPEQTGADQGGGLGQTVVEEKIAHAVVVSGNEVESGADISDVAAVRADSGSKTMAFAAVGGVISLSDEGSTTGLKVVKIDLICSTVIVQDGSEIIISGEREDRQGTEELTEMLVGLSDNIGKEGIDRESESGVMSVRAKSHCVDRSIRGIGENGGSAVGGGVPKVNCGGFFVARIDG